MKSNSKNKRVQITFKSNSSNKKLIVRIKSRNKKIPMKTKKSFKIKIVE